MRNPYRQAIAAVLIAGIVMLGIPEKVWATTPDPLPDLVYYHNDHLGSSALMTNGDSGDEGDVVHEYVYTPFGDEAYALTTYENVSNRYTGQILDEEIGLYYYNARYYDSEASRFIQADTVLPDQSSQMLNRYTYVANNPLIYTDPTGNLLDPISLAIIGAAIGVGAAASQGARGDALWKAAAAGAISGYFGGVGGSFVAKGGNLIGGVAIAAGGGAFWEGAAIGALGGALGFAGGQLGGAFANAMEFGKIGTAISVGVGAAAGGALNAVITGGDPGMAAITSGLSAGIGFRLGLDHADFLSNDWFNQLAASTTLGAGIGGVMAELQGESFWAGAADGAVWGAAGYVLSSILNKDASQKEEDTWWFKFKQKAKNGWEITKGFGEGAWDGTKNYGRTVVRHGIHVVNGAGWVVEKVTFGNVDVPDVDIPKFADSKGFIHKYGTLGKVSQGFAHGSLIAAEAAALCKITGFNPSIKMGFHPPHHNFPGRGPRPHFQINTWKSGVKGSGKVWRIPF